MTSGNAFPQSSEEEEKTEFSTGHILGFKLNTYTRTFRCINTSFLVISRKWVSLEEIFYSISNQFNLFTAWEDAM